MSEDKRIQAWRAFWSPSAIPESPGDARPEIPFEEGKTVIISDSGGFTPKTYHQLYKANHAANTTEVKQVLILTK